MGPDRGYLHDEGVRDLAVGQTPGDEGHNLPLPGGQPVKPVLIGEFWVGLLGHPIKDPPGH